MLRHNLKASVQALDDGLQLDQRLDLEHGLCHLLSCPFRLPPRRADQQAVLGSVG